MTLKKINRVLHHVTSVLNNPYVKKGMKYGASISSAYATWAEKPTPWTAVRAAFVLLNEVTAQNEIWAYDYFDADDGWVEPFSRDFNGTIHGILSKYPAINIQTSSESQTIRLHEVQGLTFGYTFSTKVTLVGVGGRVDHIYCKANQVAEAREFLRKKMWESLGGQSLVMRRNDNNFRSFDEDRVIFEPDVMRHSMPSKRADQYTEYLGKCIAAGEPRSIMFYGPPGTGKSTVAKTIVENLGLRSFRIRVGDAGLDCSVLFESINIFQPEAIIFDDFDRAHNQAGLLETLEHFHERVKLVIATVNRRDKLDEALLRPGRFDELDLVKEMDDDVVKKVLGEENMDAFPIVRRWPIAFIQEYVKRTHFMSKEDAVETIKELAARVLRLSEFNDDNDLQQVTSAANDISDEALEEAIRRVSAANQASLDDGMDDPSLDDVQAGGGFNPRRLEHEDSMMKTKTADIDLDQAVFERALKKLMQAPRHMRQPSRLIKRTRLAAKRWKRKENG